MRSKAKHLVEVIPPCIKLVRTKQRLFFDISLSFTFESCYYYNLTILLLLENIQTVTNNVHGFGWLSLCRIAQMTRQLKKKFISLFMLPMSVVNIFYSKVECSIIGSCGFISISVRNMPMCQRHTTLTNAYLSTISEHLSALYSKDLPFVTKLFNQRRNEIGITNLMFIRYRLKWDYRCFDIQSLSIRKCR